MGRPKKYFTEEDKKAAKTSKQKERRAKRSDQICQADRSKDADSHAKRRREQSPEATTTRRANAAKSQRERRQHETQEATTTTPEATTTRRANAAKSQRERRQHETQEPTTTRLANFAAKSQRERRQHETPEATTARLANAAESQRERRQHQTQEATTARRAKDAECRRERRQHETPEATTARRAQDAECRRERRQHETPEETAARQAIDAESQRLRRRNESPTSRLIRLTNDRKIHIKRFLYQAQQNQQLIQQQTINITEDETTITEHSCGSMDVTCTNCGSLNFIDEKPTDNQFSQCCQKGKVMLPRLNYPELFETLMKDQHEHSKNFMDNIRSINSSNAFASFGANISPPPGYGPFVFRVHGQIYHRTGTLYPEVGAPPQFAQLYILDASEATDQRMHVNANEHCNRDLIHQISVVLRHINPFATAYKMMQEVEEEEAQRALANNTTVPNIVMAIKQDRNQDPRRYNNPRVNEVAVVFENSDGEPPFERDILIHLRPDAANPFPHILQRINILHSNLDALLYPLFFPYGQQGWHDNIRQQGTSRRVTQLQYYSFYFSIRNYFNPLLNGGKLTQQYWVDAYVRIEANRLNFIRLNQKQLKVEDYCVVQEHLIKRSVEKGIPIGKTIILPSSFEGSPRNMQQRYQDAMAIVAKYGRPDLFVTMTCNPKWKDITDNLEPWQRAEHRPDLVARVFRIKFKSLLNEIKNGLFGEVIAMVHVIEFQKRGLPHGHILIILDRESKFRTEEDIDDFVWAEIPDKDMYPEMHNLVTSHMIHGPCGKDNPRCPCMDNGKCTKRFPKEFREHTLKDQDGYPSYRRRRGEDIPHNSRTINNSWVVPFNPYLIKRYNCHINVEVCASIRSVKYLFKYVYKGHDKANLEIQEKTINHDEPSKHVDSRYVSPPEAAWRIFAFPMHAQSHSIVRLPVHLPNKHQLYFFENDNVQDIEKTLSRTSTLLQWFELNKHDQVARDLFYREIPKHYVWKNNTWQPRQRGGGKIIGRMYTVSVAEPDRYFLRLLLLHVKGATGFDNLKTVDGVVHSTYKDAALALGLLLDDSVWRQTILDGVVLSMSKQLRELFAYICVFGDPTNPLQLWEEFKDQFTEDYCVRLHNKDGQCQNCESYAMRDIEDVFVLHRRSYSEFNLPKPATDIPNLVEEYDEGDELLLAEDMIETLNPQQQRAYYAIVHALETGYGESVKCFFIDGPGGSGKTYLYKLLMHHVRGNKKVVLPAASTGIAANLLSGGRTMHSFYGIPVPVNESSFSAIKPRTARAQLLESADLLIIDECTMAHKFSLSVIDRILREVMTTNVNDKCEFPFGGKVIVLGGDFRQCLPVVPHGTKADIVDSCLKMSSLWNTFTTLPLISNMRSLDPEYSDWLMKLGNGELSNDDNLGEDVVEIPKEMLSSGCLVTDIFGENVIVDVNDDASISAAAARAILCPKNSDADAINFAVMDRMPGDNHVYKSDDSVVADDEEEKQNYPIEFLNSLTPSGMPSHQLRLKVGAIIMLLRNLNTKKGLCNGTRLIVVALLPHLIQAKVITGCAQGDIVLIPRIDLSPSETGLPFRMKRRQFPVKPAFAMTINKSQGQTFEHVGIFLPEPVFGHGQLYVAFSRVKRSSNVKVQIVDGPLQGNLVKGSNKVFTKNVVYTNVL